MRIGFVGGSYTARSSAIADEETINFFPESIESQGAIVAAGAYGGKTAQGLKGMYGTPGILTFATMAQGPMRGSIYANGRLFIVSGGQFVELSSAGAKTVWGTVANDGNPASLAFNNIQILIVSGGRAYCFTLATNALLDVTAQLQGTPVKVDEADTFFVVSFQNSNKFQISQVLDGTTWPGQLVNAVSVFPDNIVSIIFNHRELWVFGNRHTQPYQNTGSTEVYDPIGGTLIEAGCVSPFAPCRLDNSIFWVSEDERGSRMCWRSNGYTPSRISTHAVEFDLGTYTAAQISALVTYSMQFGGHLWWVLYIPGASWNWVFDVGENLWFKWAQGTDPYLSHWGWNHVNAFGRHLLGDWNSANLYDLNMSYLTDNNAPIRRLRQSPTIGDEMKYIFHRQLVVDFDTGLGPQPPLTDGSGNPRDPQAMLQWSDDRGKTWSSEQWANCGSAGNFQTRALWPSLGSSRYRVYRLVVTDPIPWIIFDAYLN